MKPAIDAAPASEPPKRRSGRPTRDATARLESRIHQAAFAVFAREGFGDATMESVARAAGVSKRTLYDRYDSKEALFEAFVRAAAPGWLEPTAHLQPGGTPQDVLVDVGRRLCEAMLIPGTMDFYRLAMIEARRFPILRTMLLQASNRPAAQALTAYLRRQMDRGRIRPDDPKFLAQSFLNAIASPYSQRYLVDLDWPPSVEEIDTHIRRTVDLFLKGCGA